MPASLSSDKLKPAVGSTRLAPEGATGRGGLRRCQRRCAISKNCCQSRLSHIALSAFPAKSKLTIYDALRVRPVASQCHPHSDVRSAFGYTTKVLPRPPYYASTVNIVSDA